MSVRDRPPGSVRRQAHRRGRGRPRNQLVLPALLLVLGAVLWIGAQPSKQLGQASPSLAAAAVPVAPAGPSASDGSPTAPASDAPSQAPTASPLPSLSVAPPGTSKSNVYAYAGAGMFSPVVAALPRASMSRTSNLEPSR